MADLIDRKALYESFGANANCLECEIDLDECCDNCKYVLKDFCFMIADAPSVDAVPVVRCKDCKYWNPNERYCEGLGNWFGEYDSWSDYGFCYKGERKDEVIF